MSVETDSRKPNGTSPDKGGFVPPSTAELDVILDPYEFLDRLGRGNERRKRREEESVFEHGEPAAWFELPEDDTSRALQVALSKVPEKFREVITLKIWGELTFDQIGKNLDLSPNTAASRYRYGTEALRKSLEGEKVGSGL